MVDVPDDHDVGRPGPDPRLSRLDRLSRAHGWSFSGPAGEFGATSIAGFDPAGQVFGTTVAYLGPPGFGRCFVPAGGAGRLAGNTSADPHNPLIAKLHAARSLALERAVTECQALGGDGIIGARMSSAPFFSDTVEFTVEGSAVRAHSALRPATPFTTHVSGQDLARLLRSGWMPFALVFGLAIAACHFDETMFRQSSRGVGAAGNREVSGYTRLVNDARREARTALEYAVRRQGGHGAVVQEMTLKLTERECPLAEERFDYVVEAVILGSAVVPFDRSGPPVPQRPLTIMRLDRRPGTAPQAEPGPDAVPAPTLGDRAYAYWSTRIASQGPDT